MTAQQQASAGEVPEWACALCYDRAYPDNQSALSYKVAWVRESPELDNIARYIAANEPAPVDPLYRAASHMRMEFMNSPAVWTEEDWHNALREGLELHAPDALARVTVAKGGE